MPDFTLAIGDRDPHGFSAEGEAEAIRYAVGYIETQHGGELAERPQEAVTLLGESGLVTRPSECIDEYVRRIPSDHPAVDLDRIEPADANTPDCNGS